MWGEKHCIDGIVTFHVSGAIGWKIVDFNGDRYSVMLNSSDVMQVVGNVHDGRQYGNS